MALVALLGCAGNDGLDLEVRLRTDLAPLGEFTTATVRIPGQEDRAVPASAFENYVTGATLTTFEGLPAQNTRITVELTDGSSLVAARSVTAALTSDATVTVVITRDCVGLSCTEGSDTACHGGQCVDPACSPENPSACPEPECTTAADCPRPGTGCLEAVCLVGGVCGAADDDSCGTGEYCDPDDGCSALPSSGDAGPPSDGGGGMDAGTPDAGESDSGTGRECGDEVCEGFTFCDLGMCRPFPGCFSDGECGPGTVCRNNHCVPEDLDVDGDGTPAADDCGESNPEIAPTVAEICNAVDDDCDEMVDEGNPGLLCADDPAGGECLEGVCGCPEGRFDLDGEAETGCECEADPAPTVSLSCAEPTDLGELADTGAMMTVSGNALPADRAVWYRFRGADSADTSCDNLHVRVQFVENPDDAFRFSVFRGACDTATCSDEGGFTDFSWATDFRQTIDGRLSGQCPCSSAAIPPSNVSSCEDDSADYFVRVVRRAGAPLSCAGYTLEISNGLYDTM